ncbi:MAG: SlyX family protein [Bilophila sp.]
MNTTNLSDMSSLKAFTGDTATDAVTADILTRLARLERLEEQAFFQEKNLAALNDALTGQQRQLDLLELRIVRMEEKLLALWEQVGEEGGEATLPPHYQYR